MKIDTAMQLLQEYRDELIDDMITQGMSIDVHVDCLSKLWGERNSDDKSWIQDFRNLVNVLKETVDEYSSTIEAERTVAKAQYELTGNHNYLA